MSLGGLTGGSDVSGIENQLAALTPQFQDLSNQAAALSPGFESQGQDIYNIAFPQFQAGAAGQVTPDQQQAINQTLQQMNLGTSGEYANLGLGGSTMETQDLNANLQKSLAQTAGFSTLDETLGLQGLQQGALPYESLGLSALTGAGQILGGATGALQQAGSLAANQQATTLGLLGSLGSAIGGSQGLLGSGGLAGLFSGGSGAAAGAAGLTPSLATIGLF